MNHEVIAKENRGTYAPKAGLQKYAVSCLLCSCGQEIEWGVALLNDKRGHGHGKMATFLPAELNPDCPLLERVRRATNCTVAYPYRRKEDFIPEVGEVL